ncbi:MAG: tetratricopeptide repeat protein [Ktedonobacteraceae bacterium]|nr:tetratricopeptide repeat protein [Ktedonobacteraceae bacterium]
MHDSHVVLRKVVSPRLPQTILHRKSLIEKLNATLAGWEFETREDVPHYKLVLLCAPAGYGKTTLLADFARNTTIPCCWYFLDPIDADKITFLEFLLASIRYRFPQFGASLDPLLSRAISTDINHPADPHLFDTFIDALVDAVAIEITERFALILCNYHEVNDCLAVNDLVNQLLRKIPPQCVLIIESRAVPSLEFASLQVNREIIGWDSSILRFTVQEISELAIVQNMAPLSETEAEQLAVSFDGWIAGILLGTHLSDVKFLHGGMSTPPTPNSVALPMDRHHLFAYLVNEVFGREPEMYTFLKEVTLLEHMDPAICSRLLDAPDAGERLAYLEQRGMFVTRSGAGAQIIYTCHPILRELLREELRYQSPERFTMLHRRAAELFHEQQDYDQAIYHAYAISADDMMAQLIIEANTHMLSQGYTATLTRWIDMLPNATQERYPEILLISATLYLIIGEHAHAIPLLDIASQAIVENSQVVGIHDLTELQPYITVVRSKALFQKGVYQEAQESCLQVLKHLPENETVLRVETYTRLGMCANLLGDFSSGITYLQKALQLWGRHSTGQQVADIHSALASTYNQIGNFALAEHHLTRAISCCDQLNDEHGKVNNLIRMGLIKNNQGALEEAEALLTQAYTTATELRFERGMAYALVNLGELYQDQELYKQSLTATEDGLALARQVKDQYLINGSLCTLAMTYLLMRDASTAMLLVSEVDPPLISENRIGYERVVRELTYGMILLYQSAYDEACASLAAIEPAVKKPGFIREQVRVTLCIAACRLAQGLTSEVIRRLKEVTQILVKRSDYKRFIDIEFRRLPALQHFVRIQPELVQLRELLQLDPETPVVEDRPVSISKVSTSILLVADYPRLKIQALGEPLVVINNKPITHWRMRRSLEVFLFLLDQGRPMSKEQIVTVLWSHVSEKTNPTFHSIIYHLRKTIGESCIMSQAGVYTLNLAALYGNDIWYDVAAFEKYYVQAKHAITSGDEETARTVFLEMVDLYQGKYVQSFYSNWCILRRDELQRAYLDARSQLAQIAWRHEQFDESSSHWQKILAVDNCMEEAHYGLMRYYLRQGKRGLALRQYQRCVEALHQELAIAPGQTIQNLYLRLVRSSSPSSRPDGDEA